MIWVVLVFSLSWFVWSIIIDYDIPIPSLAEAYRKVAWIALWLSYALVLLCWILMILEE